MTMDIISTASAVLRIENIPLALELANRYQIRDRLHFARDQSCSVLHPESDGLVVAPP